MAHSAAERCGGTRKKVLIFALIFQKRLIEEIFPL
jgi:hypothetical protein